jgi:hypothetical protein
MQRLEAGDITDCPSRRGRRNSLHGSYLSLILRQAIKGRQVELLVTLGPLISLCDLILAPLILHPLNLHLSH